jgi:DNA-binding HxlR family transcriptional regulator
MSKRSDCPISFTLDFLGDKWSLLIIRDIIFEEKSFYGEFLKSEEAVATNILANRLRKLQNAGIVFFEIPPTKKSRKQYYLTKKGLDLIPLILEMILWGSKNDSGTSAPVSYTTLIKEDRDGVNQNLRRELIARGHGSI